MRRGRGGRFVEKDYCERVVSYRSLSRCDFIYEVLENLEDCLEIVTRRLNF